MIQLNDKQIAEFCYRSYTAADGLWFMKVEEKYGFAAALDIDDEVWKVLPKIQARMLKSMGNVENGMEALLECFTTKLTLDGFTFRVERTGDDSGFRVIIERCPWHDLMVKSGRENLSEKVGLLFVIQNIRSGRPNLTITYALNCNIKFAKALNSVYYSSVVSVCYKEQPVEEITKFERTTSHFAQ